MKNRIAKALCSGLLAILAIQCVSAQNDRDTAVAAASDKYVISAKAGGVNYVEGSVSYVRKDGKSGHLSRRDEIAIGDVVSTGASSRAEILLNPGSFLRIGPESSFEFVTTSLNDLRIKLNSGTAIFEVFASRDFKVRVTTPNAKLLLIKSGIFRIDVIPDGGADVEVSDGEALLGDRNATLLKKGFAAKLSGRASTVAKFNRKDLDEFEAWSRTRGKELAKQSAKLKDKALRNSLLSSFNSGRWGTYSSFGLWVFNPVYGGYCFLPFGNGWSSPYGFGYNSCLCSWRLPDVIWYPPSGGYGGIGGTPTKAITPILAQGDRSPTPPFMRIEQSGGARRIVDTGFSSPDRSPRFPEMPVYTAPPSPPIVVQSAPAAGSSTGARPR